MPFSTSLRWLTVAGLGLLLVACQNSPRPPELVGQIPQATPANRQATLAPDGRPTFAFEPFTGAPGNIADELAQEIGKEAGSENIVLVRRVGAPATYRVNGYLSATGNPSSGAIFYVFDIVDGNGQRQKRISGSEIVSGASGDPWNAADDDTLNRIAKRTILEIDAWLNRPAGNAG